MSRSMNTRILYIEDDPTQAELIHILLTKEGFDVTLADDGASGLQAAAEILPELVLMDVNLPVMTGIEVAEHIRALPKLAHVPIIALTSNIKYGAIQPFIGELFADYLQKPIMRRDLLACIERCLSRTGLPR